MPTVHYISRETLRKHGIDPLQWELMNDKKRRVTTTNDAFATNVKIEVDGTIRVSAAGITAAAKSEEQQPPYKSTGMDDNNNNAEDNTSNISSSSSSSTSKLNDVQPVQQSRYCEEVIIQRMDNLQEDKCHKHSEPKVDKSKQKKDFFSRVDELRAYKEKHGRLNLSRKEDQSLYDFCRHLRDTRRAIITGKGKAHYSLDGDRIAALDAIGFDWELGAGATVASKDDKFFARVDELKAYKEKHGHLNVRQKEDLSLCGFCNNLRGTQRAIITGKGTIHYSLDDSRIAALNAIEFDWKLGAGVSKQKKDFFSRVDELKVYKERHGHIILRQKDNQSLYDFSRHLRETRRAIITGKGRSYYSLDDSRIAALDAIGFDWKLGAWALSTTTSEDDVAKEVQQNRPIIQQMDNFQEDEYQKPSEPLKAKQKPNTDFFRQVDKLKAYKEKHCHLNLSGKDEDQSLYNFCSTLRSARRAIITGIGTNYTLDGDRIAALDAIGFDWKLGVGGSSTVASNNDFFFARVDKLRAYKEKHGHLKFHKKHDQSLYNYYKSLRRAWKGKGTYRLDETRIAALDAIGFNWDPLELKMSSTSPCAMTSKSSHGVNSSKINIGDVGYRFIKEFNSGWYNGTVVEILQDAIGGWDRRCIYEDGDCEDLTLNELIRLATLTPQEHKGTIKVVAA